jgi:ABC-type Fe3+-hydroxamate transport system substrate-binding protein
VRDGRIFGEREYSLLRPGPRVVDALEKMARFVHPERFPDGRAPGAQGGGSEGER